MFPWWFRKVQLQRRKLCLQKQQTVSDSDSTPTLIDLGHDRIEDSQQHPTHEPVCYGALKTAVRTSASPLGPKDASQITPLLERRSQRPVDADHASHETVGWSIYFRFLGMARFNGWLVVLAIAASSKLLDVVGLYFLKLSSQENDALGHSNKLNHYALCALLGAALSAMFVIVGYHLCIIPASWSIHKNLVGMILGAKVTFFDATSIGQILSRFTNDMNKVDSQVGAGLITVVALSVTALSSVLVILSTSVLNVFYLLPITATYIVIQSYYLHACRQLRKIEGDARGSILSVATEIQTGAPVILSYGRSEMFKQRVRSAIDNHTIAWGPYLALDVGLMLRLQLLSG